MESTGFHQAHYKSTKNLHKHPVCHISKEACQFFSPVGCNIGHGLFSPVAGLSFDSKNIFLQSGLTDMTTSCFNGRLSHIALCQ